MVKREIQLLGGFLFLDEGNPSRLMTSRKGSALIAYLLISKQIKKREIVADLLWEATSTRHALQNLRELLARVRKWVPELVVTRQTVVFEPSAEVTVDLWQLQQGLQSSAAVVRDEALRYYQGDLLASLYVEGAPRFHEWLLMERERLRRQVIYGHQQLCRDYAEQQQWLPLIDVAQRWLVIDDLDEAAYRWLMRGLAASGDLPAARRIYEQCCQALQLTLNVEPEATTIELMVQLEHEDLVTTAVSSASTLSSILSADALPQPDRLPPNTILPLFRNDDFVGRDGALSQIASHFGREKTLPRPPVVAITGMGGIGKSQTAVEFCYRYGRYFSGGVFWLNFAEAENVAEAVAAVGSQRGLALFHQHDGLTLAEQVGRVQRAWQEATPRLLVFDNCESELLLKQWLPISGGCYVLMTSRRQRWSRELRVNVVPLEMLLVSDSVALLQQLTPDVDKAMAVAIATEVGHLPLALHLAGRFLYQFPDITPAAYLAQLRQSTILQHPSLQGAGVEHSPTDHELNVGRTFAVNLQQLQTAVVLGEMPLQLLVYIAAFAPGEPVTKNILLRLTHAEGDRTLQLAAAKSFELLSNLGFIQMAEQETVLMHRLVAAFVALALPTELQQAQQVVPQLVIEMLPNAQNQLYRLAKLPFSRNHLQFWSEGAWVQGHPLAARLGHLLARHLHDVGEYEGAQALLTEILVKQEQLKEQEGTFEKEKLLDMAATYGLCGDLAWRHRHFVAAQGYHEQALLIYREILGEVHVKTAVCMGQIGSILRDLDQYDEALLYLEQALAVLEAVLPTNDIQVGEIVNAIGLTYSKMGHYALATDYLERALIIRKVHLEATDPIIGQALNNLGTLHLRQGTYSQARIYLEQALAIRQQQLGQEHPSVAAVQHNLGFLYVLMGLYDLAKRQLKEALAIRHTHFGVTHLSSLKVFQNVAWLHVMQGAYDVGQSMLQQVLVAYEASFTPPHRQLAQVWFRIGVLYSRMGVYEQGRRYLEKALGAYEQLFGDEHESIAMAQSELGHLLAQVGEMAEAKRLLEAALAVQQTRYGEGGHPETAVTLHYLGLMAQAQGDETKARYFFAEALQIREALLGVEHPHTQQTLANLS